MEPNKPTRSVAKESVPPDESAVELHRLTRSLTIARLKSELSERCAVEAEKALAEARKKIDEVWSERVWFETQMNLARKEIEEDRISTRGIAPGLLSDYCEALCEEVSRLHTDLALERASVVSKKTKYLASAELDFTFQPLKGFMRNLSYYLKQWMNPGTVAKDIKTLRLELKRQAEQVRQLSSRLSHKSGTTVSIGPKGEIAGYWRSGAGLRTFLETVLIHPESLNVDFDVIASSAVHLELHPIDGEIIIARLEYGLPPQSSGLRLMIELPDSRSAPVEVILVSATEKSSEPDSLNQMLNGDFKQSWRRVEPGGTTTLALTDLSTSGEVFTAVRMANPSDRNYHSKTLWSVADILVNLG